LTDSPAYDDQAAFSPDGTHLVFVTSRREGTADLYTMDVQTRRTKMLTSGPGGDFRPAWSPDGSWIAFSSDRQSALPFARGRWEYLHLVDLYVIRPDGSGLRRVTKHGDFCGSPKWSADSRRLLAYCMTAEQTMANRRPAPEPGSESRLVWIDVATGAMSTVDAGDGVKMSPSILPDGDIAYIRKDATGRGAGIYSVGGRRGPSGDIRGASWSPDGSQVVFHRRIQTQIPAWTSTSSRDPRYRLIMTAGQLASFNPTGDRYVTNRRPLGNRLGAELLMATAEGDTLHVLYRDKTRNVLAPQWSPKGDKIMFGLGEFNAFFNGFKGLFLTPHDRVETGAQIAVINADGTGFREVTTGPNNNGFPSWAPDGRRFVYRTFGSDGEGLRVMDLETRAVSTLTKGYDNFPLWSPRRDAIMFSRRVDDDYEIYSIRPDGTALKRLTRMRGNDAHMAWSPDGEFIVFASGRMGFKDEVTYTDAPQPYGELFVMRYDGTNVTQLTDNQWEDGAPAWQPSTAGEHLRGR
jgi:Tol biopolymer transport system component